MLISYELYDKEGEPLIWLEGKDYIPPIGSNVTFYDTIKEGKEVASVIFFGKVISYDYNISSDELCVDCEIIDELTKTKELALLKYHELKFKKSC
jgi:hypothetical protein